MADTKSITLTKPTEKAEKLIDAIIDCCAENKVQPEETLYVLGEAVIRLLVGISSMLGYEQEEIVQVFGEGLINAELEFND